MTSALVPDGLLAIGDEPPQPAKRANKRTYGLIIRALYTRSISRARVRIRATRRSLPVGNPRHSSVGDVAPPLLLGYPSLEDWMPTIGIDAIALAVPEGYLDLADLAAARGVPAGKYVEGL